MIVVWGDDDDPPVARIIGELERRGTEHLHFQSDLSGFSYDITLSPQPSGAIWWEGSEIAVESVRGMYVRPGPTPAGQIPATAALSALASFAPAPVVNRPVSGRSNWSKPFQAEQLRVAGFHVPDTLLTTDPQAAAAFAARHDRVIYKSISGVRSIVSLLDATQPGRFRAVRNGPVQFQQWIEGTDVRVHVVGNDVFATAVESAEIDYRYPQNGGELALAPVDIPVEVSDRLVRCVRVQGLLLAGVDLRRTPSGEWYAFEINPSPGFSFYEDATGQPIASAVVQLMCSGD